MTNSFGWSLPSAAIATTEAHFRRPWSPRRRMACWIDSMGRRNPQAAVRRGSRHDAGPGEEVPLEIFVAAVEGLVEVLLRLDLLREHLGAGATQGPGDLVNAMAQPPAFSARQALRTSGSAGTSSRISTTRRLLGSALA
jgi:hypothetical protein